MNLVRHARFFPTGQKEVGLRKVVGARRRSWFVNSERICPAKLLLADRRPFNPLVMPYFNQLSGKTSTFGGGGYRLVWSLWAYDFCWWYVGGQLSCILLVCLSPGAGFTRTTQPGAAPVFPQCPGCFSVHYHHCFDGGRPVINKQLQFIQNKSWGSARNKC